MKQRPQQEYSVIIRCFNEEEHIGRLLSGIMQQNIRPKEIVLVDSGSTDATLSIASRFPVKIVNINKDEFSFGRSLNLGCTHTASDILIIASAHVYPNYRNWSDLLLAPFEDENVGLVYGKQRAADNSHFSESIVLRKWFPDMSINEQKYPFCNNANAAIRRKLWEQIPYDESLTGLEDIDWAKKITAKGYKIYYEANAVVTHVHNESYSQVYNRYYREALALKRVYPEEKIGRREFLRLLTSNILLDMREAIAERKLLVNLAGIIKFRFMQFIGTYKGFNDGYIKTSLLKDRFYYPQVRQSNTSDIKKYHGQEVDYTEVTNVQ